MSSGTKLQKRRNRTWCGYWNDNCAHQLIRAQDGFAIAGNEFAQRNVAGRTKALYAHACIQREQGGDAVCCGRRITDVANERAAILDLRPAHFDRGLTNTVEPASQFASDSLAPGDARANRDCVLVHFNLVQAIDIRDVQHRSRGLNAKRHLAPAAPMRVGRI